MTRKNLRRTLRDATVVRVADVASYLRRRADAIAAAADTFGPDRELVRTRARAKAYRDAAAEIEQQEWSVTE